MKQLESGANTTFYDKDGKPIPVHGHISSGGELYFINSYCQAVPYSDAPAQDLSELVKEGDVKLLTAEEVLAFQAPALDNVRRCRRRNRTESPKEPATSPDFSTATDAQLAEELRRRGYHVTAVKPAIIEI